jgi:hypothetical protein
MMVATSFDTVIVARSRHRLKEATRRGTVKRERLTVPPPEWDACDQAERRPSQSPFAPFAAWLTAGVPRGLRVVPRHECGCQ